MEKALNLFQARYAEGVAKSIQMIYMYMFDDGDIFFTELGQPEVKPYSPYVLDLRSADVCASSHARCQELHTGEFVLYAMLNFSANCATYRRDQI